MIVSDLEVLESAGFSQLQAKVTLQRFPRYPFTLWYRVPPEFSSCLSDTEGDGILAALLPAAMAADEELRLDATVSPTLLESVDKIQEIYTNWFPHLSRVKVEAPVTPARESMQGHGTSHGLFFSLGVDSFYSLIKSDQELPENRHKVTHLVLVRGFDIDLEASSDRIFAHVLNSANGVGERFGKRVLPVTTNLRRFADNIVPWHICHGAALSGVALVLGSFFSSVCIGSTHHYEHLLPWGSHPELDPLWTTDKTRIIHDGCEETRLGKITRISANPIAMENLRVCFRNPDGMYNCGTCRKCTLTMLRLHLAGALPKCKTLPKAIDLGAVERLVMSAERRYRLEDMIGRLGTSDTDLAIKRSLEKALAASDDRSVEGASELSGSRSWYAKRRAVVEEVSVFLKAHASVIFADDDHFRDDVSDNERLIPFLERNGQYWGRPPSSAVAIRELERLRDAGAERIVFASTAFWWLDYYSELRDYLRSHYRCVRENDDVIAFALETDG